MMKSARTRQQQGTGMFYLRGILLSVGLGVLLCFVLMLLFSIVMSFNNVPQSLYFPMTILASCVGGFAAGYSAARCFMERGLLWGLLCGGILFVLLVISDAVVSHEGLGLISFVKLAMILIVSAIGGLIGVNRKKKIK